MIIFLRILAILLGLWIVGYTFIAATKTFVLPRSAQVALTRFVFMTSRAIFNFIVNKLPTFEQKDQLMAIFAPLTLLLMVPTWLFLTTIGYTFIYLGMGFDSIGEAFLFSGSSILTLGFATADNLAQTIVAFTEATVGLILVAMLISYLPTMYSAWSRRESMVNLLEVRAGWPPSAVELVWRLHGFQGSINVNDFWNEWERWFVDIDESHTSLAALVLFRSTRVTQSWLHCAGVILDGAALYLSVLKNPESRFLPIVIRAGVMALRHMAEFFRISFKPNPHFPEDPISITREQFDAGWEILKAHGLELVDDQDIAWQNFAGWRVNYDSTLVSLSRLTMSPEFNWLPEVTFVPASRAQNDTGGSLMPVSQLLERTKN
ncbi:MAG: hypothetical protein AAF490_28375 [Chloroflexota bacterium]